MRPVIGAALVTIVGLAALFAPASAHMGATGVVKERMELMKSLAKTTKALGAMARGKVAHDGRAVVQAASLIKDHSEKIPALFPKGSMKPPSEAKPEILTDMGRFKELAQSLRAEAVKLAALGENGNRGALADQFRDVGKACSGCRRSFRSKKHGK